jgi:Domain of unknown function (DUF5060)/Cellulase (glycosyl hydrolase family 5)
MEATLKGLLTSSSVHMNRQLGFVINLVALFLASTSASTAWGNSYRMIEASFDLPQISGNPFDFTVNDVCVILRQPNGKPISLPAFFDGGQIWRFRHTPDQIGKYTVSGVTLNGNDVHLRNLYPSEFNVTSSPVQGFISIDPNDKMRFIDSEGSPYYPIGYNLAWRVEGAPPLTESLDSMGAAGVNWTRIWMCNWDGKNLDWPPDSKLRLQPGQLDLRAAKRWDDIVAAADANQIHFHLVLQHHGQYSTGADPNWALNPWNKANGGWLEKPEQFFTDAKAITLTRAKYRYIIARWAYSPAIMAWELFNEFELTDAYMKGQVADIAAWHASMARFIREQDFYHHLVVTSANVAESSVWTQMDYFEAHVYPPDVLAALAVLDARKLDRPYFYGELGPLKDLNPKSGSDLHRLLWGSLMAGSSGAGQYWSWDIVEPHKLQFHFAVARKFIDESAYTSYRGLKPIEVQVTTPKIGPLTFAAGMTWAHATQNEYTVKRGGFVEGLGGMAGYLQGNGKDKLMAPYMLFHVDFPTAGIFAFQVDRFAPAGARIEVRLDDEPVANLDLQQTTLTSAGPEKPQNSDAETTLEIPVSTGPHTLRLENTGVDWARIVRFTLSPYAPQLAVLAKGNSNYVVLWAQNRDPKSIQPVTAELRIPGLDPGNYRVTWFDTYAATIIMQSMVSVDHSGVANIRTPPITIDAAAWLQQSIGSKVYPINVQETPAKMSNIGLKAIP